MSVSQVSLISRWFVKPGHLKHLLPALHELAQEILANEPGTLTYFVHTGFESDARLQSLPPESGDSILFFETYRDADAFLDHVNGPIFKKFVAEHGDDFVPGADGKPYTTVEFLSRQAGFTRGEDRPSQAAAAPPCGNRHPSVMFELIAREQPALRDFYSKVFGWTYKDGDSGFSYIHFPASSPPLLGGIGQADPAIPGFEPGRNFYLLVDRIEPVLDAAIAAGARPLMPPGEADGYRFAMFRDPEGNPVGLIEPFAD